MLEMVPNRFLLCVTLFLGVLTTSREDEGKNRYHQPGDITLGGLFTLHFRTEDGKCGEFIPVGLTFVEAMIFAIEKINRNPKLLPNLTLGYDIRDYCASPTMAMEHTYDFVRRNEIVAESQNGSSNCAEKQGKINSSEVTPIAAVIGPEDSGSAVLVGSLFEVAAIAAISYSATSDELSSPQYRHLFRTAPPDRQQARTIADIIQHFNWSYVAALAMDDSYGRNGMMKLESEAEERKTFCLSFVEYIPKQQYSTKIKRVARKLKTYPNIRVVVLWILITHARQFLEEAAKQKLSDRTWIFSDGVSLRHDTLVGLKNGDRRIVHGSFGIQPPYLLYRDFVKFFIKKSSKTFTRYSSPWWREFWQNEHIVNSCLSVNRSERDSCIEKVLLSIYNTYIPYIVDAVTAAAHALHDMKHCSPSQRESSEEVINPKELDKYLRRVDFNGLTGRVRFDQFGDPVTSSYRVVHYQLSDTLELVDLVIGSWDKSRKKKLQLNVTSIKWNTNSSQERIPRSFCRGDCPAGTFRSLASPCCWDCLKCPDGTVSSGINDVNCTKCLRGQAPDEGRSKCLDLPEIGVTWSSLTSVLVILFAAIGLFLVAICSFFLHKHRETPLVKAANRELSLVLMLTIMMSFCASILSLAKPTNIICSLVHCWRSMVLVTFVSILIIKTMKILSAFQINVIAERFKKFILTSKSQTLIVIALTSIPAVFLSLWIVLDSPRQQRIIQPLANAVLLSCSLHQSWVGMTLEIAISVYTLFLAVVCTFYAFKARSLPENFNEARYIGFSMYILLLSSVGYLPINIGLKGSYATILTCAMTLLSSYGLLTCMFIPKIYVILRQPEQNTQEAVSSQVSEYSFRSFRKDKTTVVPMRSDATNNQNNLHLKVVSANDSRNQLGITINRRHSAPASTYHATSRKS